MQKVPSPKCVCVLRCGRVYINCVDTYHASMYWGVCSHALQCVCVCMQQWALACICCACMFSSKVSSESVITLTPKPGSICCCWIVNRQHTNACARIHTNVHTITSLLVSWFYPLSYLALYWVTTFCMQIYTKVNQKQSEQTNIRL